MRGKIIAGNWKMNGCMESIEILLQQLRSSIDQRDGAQCIVMPPSIYIPLVKNCLSESSIKWGAQNVYPQDAGAFTGELSAPMLQDYSCSYVLVGHSERRRLFCEDEKFVADKFHHVKEHGMIPILCVGETFEEREQGRTKEVLTRQLLAVCANNNLRCFKDSVIAYEPVWAIGTGRTASPEQVQEVHSLVRAFVADLDREDADCLSILYGGSVNEKNARALFEMPDVDGGLIGGASLNAQQFVEIVKCIN
ncbi:triose-phosphate isomerase [Legionella fairfieldensis]|uniref:triose-phosphate isomerase n=1 Tax=Legionella fairfieldensis TaxID=45064 RepID=UPI00048C5ED0|nr:triose-phosphate isomerase [Legionella fairfieldensis]